METNRRVFPLNGEWEFYWNEYLNPDDFTKISKNTDNFIFIRIPSSWKGFILNGKKLPVFGYATYRLILRNAITNHIYGFKIRYIDSNYKLWANRQLIGKVGELTTNDQNAKGYYRPQIFSFYNQNTNIEIVIQAANFFAPAQSGIRESIWFGEPEELHGYSDNQIIFDMTVMGCLLALGFYHLLLYAFRKFDKTVLFFGLLCLALAFHALFAGEIYAQRIIPDSFAYIAYKIYMLGILLEFVFTACYFYSIFNKLFNRKLLVIFLLLYTVYGLIILLTDYNFHYALFKYFEIICTAMIIYIFYINFLAVKQKSEAALFILIGFFLYILTIIKDLLTAEYIIYSVYIRHFGVLAFAISQTYVLAYRFSNAFNTVEKLSEKLTVANRELETVNTNLEKIVDERTLNLKNEIRERIKIENKLAFSEERFRDMADFLPSIICETDMDGHITYINNKGLDLFQIKKNENSIIHFINDLVYYDDREKIRRDINKLLNENEFETKQYRFLEANSSSQSQHKRMALVNCGIIRKDNLIKGFRWTIVDIQAILNTALLPEEILFQEYHFTNTEKNVIKQILLGYNNNEICSKLFISKNTLKTHISNIFDALNVKSREQLFQLIAQYQANRLGNEKIIRYLLQSVIKE